MRPVPVSLPMFDGREVAFTGPAPLAELPAEARAADLCFRALGPEERHRAARHVFAYACDHGHCVGWEGLGMARPEDPAAIWAHVRPVSYEILRWPRSGGAFFVSLEARCDWEDEHGLQMVWEGGRTLVKVGGHDGLVLNPIAMRDPDGAGIVYHATHPQWTTRQDD